MSAMRLPSNLTGSTQCRANERNPRKAVSSARSTIRLRPWDRRGPVVLKEKECCVPASQYIHPEFGFFCPAPRLRRRVKVTLACLAVAGLGATMMAAADRHGLDAVAARGDEASIVETLPPMCLAPSAGVGTGLATPVQAPIAAEKPPCFGHTQPVG